MKQAIRKWLGITEKPTDEQIADEVRRQLLSYSSSNSLREKIELAVFREHRLVIQKQVKEIISEFDKEEFIDKIVERIKRKQLT